jgi:uncharacterized protein (DUF2225 family)
MARRDVDFPLLRGLPGRRVVTAAAGETILREGEAGGELHVIVSGKVRLVRAGSTIAEIGAGELLGELALLSGAPQPYGAVAEAASTLIAVPGATALGAIAQSPKFATGLAQTAADRAIQLTAAGAGAPSAEPVGVQGQSPAGSARHEAAVQAAEMARQGMEPSQIAPASASSAMPTGGVAEPPSTLLGESLLGDAALPPWEAAKQAAAEGKTPDSVDKSIPKPEAFWKKSFKCPICDASFQSLQVRDQFVEVSGRDSDLYDHHKGINLLHYAVVVCPSCFFAALPDDFPRVYQNEREAIQKALAPIRPKVKIDFTDREYRTAAHAQASFELAILSYGQRLKSYRKVAGMYHRLAWLARAAGQPEIEKRQLAVARDGYRSALEKREIDEPRVELTVMYLVADISRRLDDTTEAGKWVGQVLQHPQIGSNKMIAGLARDLHQDLRTLRAKT